MVKPAVEFWWKMFLTIFPAKEARKSPSKLRRKFATNFAENFANLTLEIAGTYKGGWWELPSAKVRLYESHAIAILRLAGPLRKAQYG